MYILECVNTDRPGYPYAPGFYCGIDKDSSGKSTGNIVLSTKESAQKFLDYDNAKEFAYDLTLFGGWNFQIREIDPRD